jgi:urocanate hydratase
MKSNREILQILATGIPSTLPKHPARDNTVPHAPKRNPKLTTEELKLAISNALRYFPTEWHETLANEFLQEYHDYGHIYMYRFRPTYTMKAYSINDYPHNCKQGAAIMLMIQNNLDPRVAQLYWLHFLTF